MHQTTIIIGNVGRDPELRFTPSGVPVCSFSVATSRSWTDADLPTKANGDPVTCGLAYYVVALYLDFEDKLQETDSSDTSWYDKPCP